MKKSELIEVLNSIEGDPEVIISKDSEGNEYSPVKEWADLFYDNGIVYYGDKNLPSTAIEAIVLWPTN